MNNIITKKRYYPTALVLYLNYLLEGMENIILAQCMAPLIVQLGTNKAGVAYVISGLGIGKIAVLLIAGVLCDKYGRRLFVNLGMGVFLIFFVGILLSKSVTVAFVFAIIGGMANSFMDAGTYPALMDAFPESEGTANILVKAFIAAGQFILPLMIGYLLNNNLYFGYSFIFCIIGYVILGLFLFKLPFPDEDKKRMQGESQNEGKSATAEVESTNRFVNKPKFSIEGIALIAIGFTCTTTFYLISVWLPTYGQEVVGMAKTASLALISYYSIGSLISVFITAYLVKSLVKPVTILFVYPLISFIFLVILLLVPTPTICKVCGFMIGFAAAGGVLQLTITTMAQFFPGGKGKATGFVNTACSAAFFIIPVATGIISKTSISGIILLNIVITGVGILLSIIVNIRYHKVFGTSTKKISA